MEGHCWWDTPCAEKQALGDKREWLKRDETWRWRRGRSGHDVVVVTAFLQDQETAHRMNPGLLSALLWQASPAQECPRIVLYHFS